MHAPPLPDSLLSSLLLRMLEASGDPMYAAEIDHGFRLIYVNAAACRHFGWPKEQLLAKRLSECDVLFDASAAANLATRLRQENFAQFEALHRTADGAQVPVEVSATHVSYLGNDYCFGCIRPPASHTRIEQALQISEARLVTTERLAKLGHWEIDLATEALLWSHAVPEMFNLPDADEDPTASLVLRHVPPEDHDKLKQAFRQVVENASTAEVEFRVVSATGKIHVAFVRGQAEFAADGRPRRIVGTVQDLTERKSLEAQYLRAQRMESVGMLAGSIAHDLNNILAPILMSAQLLRLKSLDPACRKLAETIESNTQRGADVVRKVLGFARGVRGEPTPLSAAQLVKETVEMISGTFPRNIQITSSVDKNLPLLRADPTLVHQVLLNLCVNARDAMPAGGTLTLRVSERHVHRGFVAAFNEAIPGHYVCLHVADTGVGIPPEYLERIFEPFFSSKGAEGTGLGLPTVLGIVKGSGGFVEVLSTPGQGSEFIACFPAVGAHPIAPPSPAETPIGGRGRRILVVDDELPIRSMLVEMLKMSGFEVVAATNGQEAVALAGQIDPDAVLTDLMMPGMDGPRLISELRKKNHKLPIIAMSGAAALSLAKHPASELPGLPLLQKPFTLHTLLNTLAEVIPVGAPPR